ncbi:unnamed protein product [Closterium sp. NIES-65]|nr:unnamed protein product [Closterium sp. NIES-65]
MAFPSIPHPFPPKQTKSPAPLYPVDDTHLLRFPHIPLLYPCSPLLFPPLPLLSQPHPFLSPQILLLFPPILFLLPSLPLSSLPSPLPCPLPSPFRPPPSTPLAHPSHPTPPSAPLPPRPSLERQHQYPNLMSSPDASLGFGTSQFEPAAPSHDGDAGSVGSLHYVVAMWDYAAGRNSVGGTGHGARRVGSVLAPLALQQRQGGRHGEERQVVCSGTDLRGCFLEYLGQKGVRGLPDELGKAG